DETSFGDGVGRYNVFANNNSAIVWHPTTGPMVIQGAIHSAWVNQGSGEGPLGYPTSDEFPLGGGAAYSDFQNGVLYWDGTKLATPAIADVPGAQMATLARKVLQSPLSDIVDYCSLSAISKTGYDFLRSGTRQDTFFLDGQIDAAFANDYAMSVTLRFLTV